MRVISQGSCLNCGSSDANTEYDDGHFYCYSCRKYTPARTNINTVVKRFEVVQDKCSSELPQDFSLTIPAEPMAWLKQYGLTNKELADNNIGWSQSRGLLIFPFYDGYGAILCWQGRYFPPQKPKVHTQGLADKHHLIKKSSDNSSTVVVVEDIISAIKVSRVVDCCVLLGSNISMHKATGLSRLYDTLIIWLDFDKTKEMIKFQQLYNPLFNNIKVVATEFDPKEYSTEEIIKIIKG